MKLEKITIEDLNQKSILDLSKKKQLEYSVLRGRIRGLVGIHNDLVDKHSILTRDSLSLASELLKSTCTSLENQIDTLLDQLNAFTDKELDKVYSNEKSKKTTKKKAKKR